jgi:2-amino-4-hydroxy-6-hydroxymethyldihydropteridine diphosphokinase
MPAAAIALGSNLGNRLDHLRAGVAAIAALPETRLTAISSAIETPALVSASAPPGPDYLNSIVLVETSLQPRDLLARLLEIERARGRERHPGSRWEARTLDLDLLFWGDRVVDEPSLRLPHPEMHRRRFVLQPLVQVARDWVHPLLRRSVAELLRELDQPEVQRR